MVCARAARRPRPLASNMKLFTTSTGALALRAGSAIATKVLADGEIDRDGVLHGSLYLQGGGDPALGTPAFYNRYLAGLGTNLFALTPQIRAAGMTAVTGRLYADDTIFDRLRGVADSGYATSSYIGPLSGLAFNSGFSGSTAAAASPPTRPSSPPRSWLALAARRGESRSAPRSRWRTRRPGRRRRSPSVRSPTISADRQHHRRRLRQLLRRDAAEAARRRIRRRRDHGRRGRPWSSSSRAAKGSGVHAVDGSGLTRSNRASPQQVVRPAAGDARPRRSATTSSRPGPGRPRRHGRRTHARHRRRRPLPDEDRHPDRGQQPLRLLLQRRRPG